MEQLLRCSGLKSRVFCFPEMGWNCCKAIPGQENKIFHIDRKQFGNNTVAGQTFFNLIHKALLLPCISLVKEPMG